MRIRDLLAAESIELNGSAAGKQDVLNKMVDLMAKSGKIRDVETYRKGVFAREEEGTTGIGEGIAIPHCKSDAVKAPGLAAMVVKDGVEFDALDGAPVNLLFLIAAPNTEDKHRLAPDEMTAPVVLRIFEQAARGDSSRKIALDLNEDGVIPPLKYRVLYRDEFSEDGAARASDLCRHPPAGKMAEMRTGRTVVSHQQNRL